MLGPPGAWQRGGVPQLPPGLLLRPGVPAGGQGGSPAGVHRPRPRRPQHLRPAQVCVIPRVYTLYYYFPPP